MRLANRFYMIKKIITFFLIAIFTAFMTAPTLSIFSDSIDSSIFYSLNEEDTTTKENLKVFKVHSAESNSTHLAVFDFEEQNLNIIYLISYTPYVTECISPPPELA